MYLDVKNQTTIYEPKLHSINGNKECICDVFREWNNASMLRLN